MLNLLPVCFIDVLTYALLCVFDHLPSNLIDNALSRDENADCIANALLMPNVLSTDDLRAVKRALDSIHHNDLSHFFMLLPHHDALARDLRVLRDVSVKHDALACNFDVVNDTEMTSHAFDDFPTIENNVRFIMSCFPLPLAYAYLALCVRNLDTLTPNP